MDFFAQQARVRGSSRRLVLLFALAVIAIVVTVDLVVWVSMGRHGLTHTGWANRRLIPLTTIGMLLVIGGCAMYRIMSLSNGGKAVAEGMGAIPVSPDTRDPQLRLLRNVIEEVAIASGSPVPDIYLMQDEPGINAFAAGYSVSDAAICVTQGCLDNLTRDELQGVIAHEFSHVLNGDMRLNIRLIGLLFGIMALAVIGRQLLNFGNVRFGRRGSNDGRVWVIGLALLAVGYIGYFFGRLIQASVARSRESLADVSAVQFTRQTEGIAGALKKIAALGDGSRLQAANRHEVAHMLFGESDAPGFFDGLYATHPPLMKRIRSLDPGFRESELETIFSAMQDAEAARAEALEREPEAAASPLNPIPFTLGTAVAAAPMRVESGGNSDQAGAAAAVSPATSAALIQATKQPESALTLMFAIVLSPQEALAATQRRSIASAFGDDMQYAVAALAEQVKSLAPGKRMSLLALSFPVLKQLPEGRLQTFLGTLESITRTNSQVGLEDYCLARLMRLQLSEALHPRSAPVDGQKKLPACIASASFVIAIVAAHGSSDDAAARRAWLLAMADAFPGNAQVWQTPPMDWQQALDRALDELDGLMPAAKEIFIQGLVRAIRADDEVTAEEMALLRVICASLHCVMPLH
jgi:Zn-dependent protease with chaperone function